jgi:hypothetical protein
MPVKKLVFPASIPGVQVGHVAPNRKMHGNATLRSTAAMPHGVLHKVARHDE